MNIVLCLTPVLFEVFRIKFYVLVSESEIVYHYLCIGDIVSFSYD
jgi:hypothetical protein